MTDLPPQQAQLKVDNNSSQKNTTEDQVIRGIVSRVVFRNPDNGYTVMKIDPGKGDEVTVVGKFLSISAGMHLIIRGQESSHSKYGTQFQAQSFTQTEPSTASEIERYLSSGLIKGIGAKTAEKLVEAFGEKTIETINKDPEAIAKIAGVGLHKAKLIQEAFAEQQDERESMRFLLEHSITPLFAQKIYKLYGTKTVELISKNPYQLAQDIWGIGFTTADGIAANLGIARDSPLRIKAGLIHTLERAAEGEGHVYLPGKLLGDRARSLLGLEDSIDLGPFVEELKSIGDLISFDDSYYLPLLNRAEDFVSNFVARRTSPWKEPRVSESQATRILKELAEKMSFQFSTEQGEAVLRSVAYPLMVITGGPGCGKTTIIQAICAVYKEMGLVVRLAAPTGRAAQRMAQVCSMNASTIHRLLKFDPSKRGFLHGPNDPLVADVVIIDEASMIDIHLAQSLFSAIGPKTSLILVGDKDQLPSVGPGKILGDLLSLVEVKSISLSQIFRRSSESSINEIAHAINSGNVPDIPVPDGETKTDAYFIPRSDPEEVAGLVQKLLAEQIPKKFEVEATDIVVLTPSNRGPLGTQALNEKLQAFLNPSGKIDVEQELQVGDGTLRIGDRVCQRVNNYHIDEHGVFNGDVGQVYSVDRHSSRVTVELWDGRLIDYERGDLTQLSLAYAVTVHRSQGSEIPCVVLVLHDSHYTLLERQLVYTAVTRAKKLLIIVGTKRALAIACKRTNTQRRLTRLPERIREFIQNHK